MSALVLAMRILLRMNVSIYNIGQLYRHDRSLELRQPSSRSNGLVCSQLQNACIIVDSLPEGSIGLPELAYNVLRPIENMKVVVLYVCSIIRYWMPLN